MRGHPVRNISAWFRKPIPLGSTAQLSFDASSAGYEISAGGVPSIIGRN